MISDEVEEWRFIDLENFPYSQVSSFGRVKSLRREIVNPNGVGTRVLSEKIGVLQEHEQGYLEVMLNHNKRFKTFSVHRLVCSAFHPNPENKSEVNHKDGIKWNNHKNNVEWSTRSENQIHAFKTKLQTRKKGTSNPSSKLSESDILDIRKSNLTQDKLSEIYGVNQSTISSIIRRTTWTHVKDKT